MAINYHTITVNCGPGGSAVDRQWFSTGLGKNRNLAVHLHGGGGDVPIYVAQTNIIDIVQNDLTEFDHVFLRGMCMNPSGAAGFDVGDASMILLEGHRIASLEEDGLYWNDGRSLFTYDDMLFIDTMWLLLTGQVGGLPFTYHQARIFLSGASNGGNMTHRYLIERPTRFAGGYIVAAEMNLSYAPTTEPGPRFVCIEQGTGDPLMEYSGATRDGEFTTPATNRRAFWMRQANIPLGTAANTVVDWPDTVPGDGCKVVKEEYLDGDAPLLFWTVRNGGHNTRNSKVLPDFNPDDARPGPKCRDGDGLVEFCQRATELITATLPEPWITGVPQYRMLASMNSTGVDVDDMIVFSDDECMHIAQFYQGATANSQAAKQGLPAIGDMEIIFTENPDFEMFTYKNSTFNPGSEVDQPPLIETDPLEFCQFYFEGILLTNIGTSGMTSFSITLENDLGLVPSTAATTTDIDNYVTFCRIGAGDSSELIRIGVGSATVVDNLDGTATISGLTDADRGFGGTSPTAHLAGAQIFGPMYAGDSHPGGTAGQTIRYALRFWSQEVMDLFFMAPEIAGWITDGISSGVWWDICSPSPFNIVNAVNDSVDSYNFNTGLPMTIDDRREFKEIQLSATQRKIFGLAGVFPVVTCNNNRGDYEAADGGAEEFAMDTGDPLTNITQHDRTGLVMEGVFAEPGGTYLSNSNIAKSLAMLCDGMQKNYQMMPNCKPDETFPPIVDDADHIARDFYDFCGIMLAIEPSNPRYYICHQLFVDDPGDIGAGTHVFWLDVAVLPWWFLSIGDPLESADGLDFSPLRSDDWDGVNNNTLWRRFERGIVLFNPTDNPDSVATTLPTDKVYLDYATGAIVTSVTLGANGCKTYMAVDFVVDDDTVPPATIGTLTSDFGTGPYTYIQSDAATTPFVIASDGEITLVSTIVHEALSWWFLNITVEDDLNVTQERTVVFASKD